MDNYTYTIQEICDQTRLPRRTIHFYIQQGLLPAPAGAGLSARYGQNHLARLRAIPILRKQGLRLNDIRDRFVEMAESDIENLITSNPSEPVVEMTRPPGKAFLHIPLSDEITLLVPSGLSPTMRQKCAILQEIAAGIFGKTNQ